MPITYANIDISGNNVVNASTNNNANAAIKLAAGGTFRVKSGGVFKFQHTNGFTGSTNTAVSSTNNPIIVLDPGSTIEYNDTIAVHTQNITSRQYSNLVLSGAAAKSMAGSTSISGDFTVSGGTVTLPANITFNGTSGTQNITGLNYNSITFTGAGTKAFASDASIAYNGVLSLGGGILDLNGKTVTLKAGTGTNYPSTATVGQVDPTASIVYNSGKFLVERYIPAKRAYRFVTSSVTTSTSLKINWMEGGITPPTSALEHR